MFNKSGTYYVAIVMAFICLAFLPYPLSAQSDDLSEKIWEGIGGKQNWENARYFMFTCQGTHGHARQQAHTASYLWDRQTGNCRFEGSTSDNKDLVVLFNLHDAKGQVFIDDVPQDTGEIIEQKIDKVLRGFKEDAELLFLPAILDGRNVRLSLESEKLVGASRQLVARVRNDDTAYGAPLEGIIHVDAQSGQICQWIPQHDRGTNYEVSGYKDIGGGLILPTRFTAQQGGSRVVYPVAATLVHIESKKFTHP